MKFNSSIAAVIIWVFSICFCPGEDGLPKPNEKCILTMCIVLGKSKEVDALLSGGISPVGVGVTPHMPMYYAIMLDKPDCLYLLLKFKENPAALWGSAISGFPLSLAATFGKIRCAELLLEYGAPINQADEQGFSVLFRAIISQNIEMISLIVSNGGLLNERDKKALPEDAISWIKKHLKLSEPAFQWVK